MGGNFSPEPKPEPQKARVIAIPRAFGKVKNNDRLKIDVYDDYGNIDRFWETWSSQNTSVPPVDDVVQSRYRKCEVCGKEFYIAGQAWTYKLDYKNKVKYFCGWTHMQKFRKEHGIK